MLSIAAAKWLYQWYSAEQMVAPYGVLIKGVSGNFQAPRSTL